MADNRNDPESLPGPSNTFAIMKILDQVPNHLREMLGVSKVALSYFVRDDPTSPVPLPPLQTNVIWSFERSFMMDELVNYMPHTGQSYEVDNLQIYKILAKDLVENNATTSIESHQKRIYGR